MYLQIKKQRLYTLVINQNKSFFNNVYYLFHTHYVEHRVLIPNRPV